MVDFYGLHVGKYTVRPMDAMGKIDQFVIRFPCATNADLGCLAKHFRRNGASAMGRMGRVGFRRPITGPLSYPGSQEIPKNYLPFALLEFDSSQKLFLTGRCEPFSHTLLLICSSFEDWENGHPGCENDCSSLTSWWFQPI